MQAAPYELRESLRRYAVSERISGCATRVVGDPAVVVREYADGHRSAHYSKINRCQSDGCPACAADRERKWQAKLKAGSSGSTAGQPWRMLTWTAPHHAGESLVDVWDRISDFVRKTKKHRRAKHLWKKVSMSARTWEMTWSERNGWHPHCHELVQTSLSDAELAELVVLYAELSGASVEHGLHATSAVVVDGALPLINKYLAKRWAGLAGELSSGGKKAREEHMNVAQLATWAATGNARGVALWQEYQRAVHGRHPRHMDKRFAEAVDRAPDDESRVVAIWKVPLLREEYAELVHSARRYGEWWATWLPLEQGLCAPGDPVADVRDVVDELCLAAGRRHRRPMELPSPDDTS